MESGSMGLVIYQNKILLFLRDNKPEIVYPNTWSWIGGGQENGESLTETGLREIKEEIGVRPKNYTLLGVIDRGIDRQYGRFIAILDTEEYTKVKKGNEGQKIAFFTWDEINNIEITPNMRKFLDLNTSEIQLILKSENFDPNKFKFE